MSVQRDREQNRRRSTLAGDSFAEERIVLQAQKLKGAREALADKLEDYRRQHEEAQIRAIAAEVEVTSLQSHLQLQEQQMEQCMRTIEVLNKDLETQRELCVEKDKSLQHFHRKVAHIRSALMNEVSKLRDNENDLKLGFDSFSRCIDEFRSDNISKKDFLSAADLIFSTVNEQDMSLARCSRAIETIFGNTERLRLATLSSRQRKSRLAQLVNMLSPKQLVEASDDELLDTEDCHSPLPVPPPVPVRRESIMALSPPSPSLPTIDFRDGAQAAFGRGPGEYTPTELQNSVGHYTVPEQTESDSDSDFETFVPPVRIKRHHCSDLSTQSFPAVFGSQRAHPQAVLRGTGSLPQRLTGKRKRKVQGRSKSFNDSLVVLRGSDDSRSNTMDSSSSSHLEHVSTWQKALLKDSSVFTGSLPRIYQAIDDSDLEDSYIDPSEIAAAVINTGTKHGAKVSTRLHNRVHSFVGSSTDNYIALVGLTTKPPEAVPPSSNGTGSVPPITPYLSLKTALASSTQYKKTFTFPNAPPPDSGSERATPTDYLSDSSSGGDGGPLLTRNPTYARIPGNFFNNVENTVYTGSLPTNIPQATGIYEELDSPLGQHDELSGFAQGKRRLWSPPRHDAIEVLSENGGAEVCPPIPPPRNLSPIHADGLKCSIDGSSCEGQLSPAHLLKPTGIGPLPLYTTLRGSRRVKLVPLSSPHDSTPQGLLSDEYETPEHLYSLGQFVAVDTPCGILSRDRPKPSIPPRRASQPILPRYSPPPAHLHTSSSSPAGCNETDGRDETVTVVLGESAAAVTACPPLVEEQKSQTLSAMRHRVDLADDMPLWKPPPVVKKSGYLRKMDPKPKRLWFVLNGTELKYYRNKESFFKPNRAKATVSLESWCKLSRLSGGSSFELATPKKIFRLSADRSETCDEWFEAFEAVLTTPIRGKPTKPKVHAVDGWARVTQRDGLTKRVWCCLEDCTLYMSSKPGGKPASQINLHRATIQQAQDSLLLDSRLSMNDVQLLVTEQDQTATTITPDKVENSDAWLYHLNAASSGSCDLNLTLTEKLLAQIVQEGGGKEHLLWKHPVLKCTTGPLRGALTSLPSKALNEKAVNLFQSVQLFMNTAIDPLRLDYHMSSVQHLIDVCIKHPRLQNEAYCQVLRQISGHTDPTSPIVLKGWLLLLLLILFFLPSRKFFWYLQMFLEMHFSHHPTIAEYAKKCQSAIARTQANGPRETRPSKVELKALMSADIHRPFSFPAKPLSIHVHLMDSSVQEVWFSSSTTVRELVAELNTAIGMPDVDTTGFALMCDWPGMQDRSNYYLFPASKLCDTISLWSSALHKLNHSNTRQHRFIMLTYRNRVMRQDLFGCETDKQAALLAHQISKEVVSDRHLLQSTKEGIRMAAIMAQMEYGDWSGIESGTGGRDQAMVAREALQKFCPQKFIHLALEHDQSLLQKDLVEQWKLNSGRSNEECAHMYLKAAQEWRFYGAALFEAEERFQLQKTRALWLAVHEDCVALLYRHSMETLVTYTYSEVSTFGGHGDDFMLVVAPQQISPTRKDSVHIEKVLLAMSKVQIREATFLIAHYLEAFVQHTHTHCSPNHDQIS